MICRGTFEGREVLGMRLNWHKRYITLGPVATVLGLAFKLYDPDHLLGEREELGITRRADPDQSAGRRDRPPASAGDAGVSERPELGPRRLHSDRLRHRRRDLGQGWKMLMTALAAGRGISLPSLSAAGAALPRAPPAPMRASANSSMPIGKFEGIQERLARIAATAYLLDAARRLTCAGLDHGHHPAVIAAIMKPHATERMRIASTTPWTSTAARR